VKRTLSRRRPLFASDSTRLLSVSGQCARVVPEGKCAEEGQTPDPIMTPYSSTSTRPITCTLSAKCDGHAASAWRNPRCGRSGDIAAHASGSNEWSCSSPRGRIPRLEPTWGSLASFQQRRKLFSSGAPVAAQTCFTARSTNHARYFDCAALPAPPLHGWQSHAQPCADTGFAAFAVRLTPLTRRSTA
jgi:hypothetical protein